MKRVKNIDNLKSGDKIFAHSMVFKTNKVGLNFDDRTLEFDSISRNKTLNQLGYTIVLSAESVESMLRMLGEDSLKYDWVTDYTYMSIWATFKHYLDMDSKNRLLVDIDKIKTLGDSVEHVLKGK